MIRLPPWAAAILLLLLAALLLFVLPAQLDAAIERYGVQGVALLLFFPAVAAPIAAARTGDGGTPWTALAGISIPLLTMIAATQGTVRHLRLVPAAGYLAGAAYLHASLRSGSSIFEQMIRGVMPFAPDFIGDYCRALTRFWAAFFVVAAGVVGWLGWTGDVEAWRLATGWGIATAICAVLPVEFLIRKAHFRYYFFGGPFDRLFARFFPAEETELGRASLEHIRKYRAGELEVQRPKKAEPETRRRRR